MKRKSIFAIVIFIFCANAFGRNYEQIIAPPTDESECTFLTLDAFTPYVKDYSGSEAGKMAHYLVRWRMRDGALSAWGETVSATITG